VKRLPVRKGLIAFIVGIWMMTNFIQGSPLVTQAFAVAQPVIGALFQGVPELQVAPAVPSPAPADGSTVFSEKGKQEIPPLAQEVYQQAVAQRCPALPVTVLAGLAWVESGHARALKGLQPNGDVDPILGPVLNGKGRVARIMDTDNGQIDGHTVFDRAVGIVQFIPGTWKVYAIDANGDGQASPNNIHDAAHSSANYLCQNGAANAGDPRQLGNALFRYNRSCGYGRHVMAKAREYGLPDSVQAVCPR
jgi:hypothetical protein